MKNVRVIDLTHPITEDLHTAAGQVRFVRDLDYKDKGFRSHWIQMNLHIGTHADAPMHTEPGGRSIDSFDPAEFYGDAVVLDFSRKGANEAITIEDVKKAEKKLMPLQPGDVPATYADIDDLARDVGFKPATPIEEGIPRFVKWYRDFYKA